MSTTDANGDQSIELLTIDEDTYIVHHDDDTGDVTTTIVLALAEIENVDPIDLDVNLHECVDPDALNALFRSMSTSELPSSSGQVQLALNDYEVSMNTNGLIMIYPIS